MEALSMKHRDGSRASIMHFEAKEPSPCIALFFCRNRGNLLLIYYICSDYFLGNSK